MITEFTCGIYHASLMTKRWSIKSNDFIIATINPDGELITFPKDYTNNLTQSDLLEILVLMNNIKRQYKQLQCDIV